jgi:two-component system chemotaxis response regulator CheB
MWFDMQPKKLIVAGASAGGVDALTSFVRDLPADLDAAVLVVLHVSPTGLSVLPSILQRAGDLPAAHAVDGEEIEKSRIYVAPPDHHLVVDAGKLSLTRGARENGYRPAVDMLFRSAAASWDGRVIGAVLSGALDDGSAGLLAVKRGRGVAMTQDPNDAAYSSMPVSAMAVVDVDYCQTARELGRTAAALVAGDIPAQRTSLTLVEGNDMSPDPTDDHSRDKLSDLTCPNCSGAMYEVRNDDKAFYFRCRVGHGYSADSLLDKQAEFLDDALWTALRSLEERRDLSSRMAARMRGQGYEHSALRFDEREHDAEERASIIRHVLNGPARQSSVDGIDVTGLEDPA